MDLELEGLLRLLCESLEPIEASATVDTLIKITQNVEEHPGEERYRRLHAANKTFSQRVWRHELARDIMTAIGWAEVDGDVVLPSDDHVQLAILELARCKSTMQPQLGNDEATTPSREAPVQSTESGKRSPYQERMKHLREIQKKTAEERKRTMEQIKADRQETQTRETKSSHSQPLQFGGNLKRFEDIGVDLNSGGG